MRILFADEKYELEKFVQYEDIPYASSLSCNCDYPGHAEYTENKSYNVIGFCDTPQGFMVIFECPKCWGRYRHHVSMKGIYDLDSFKKDVGLILHLKANL